MAMRGLARLLSDPVDPTKKKKFTSTVDYVRESDMASKGNLVDYLKGQSRPEVAPAPVFSLNRYDEPIRPEYDDQRAESIPRTAKAAALAQGFASLLNAGLVMGGGKTVPNADVGAEVLQGSYKQLLGMNKSHRDSMAEYYKDLGRVRDRNTDISNREAESNYRSGYDIYRDSVRDAKDFDKTMDDRRWDLMTEQERREYEVVQQLDDRAYDDQRYARNQAGRGTGSQDVFVQSEEELEGYLDAYWATYNEGQRRLAELEGSDDIEGGGGKDSTAYQSENSRTTNELNKIRDQIAKIPGGLSRLQGWPQQKMIRQTVDDNGPVFAKLIHEYAAMGDRDSVENLNESMRRWLISVGVDVKDVPGMIDEILEYYGGQN
jgi:hypothetical protein